MKSITTAKLLEKLHMVFATLGLPQKIVTDNGPSFTSSEFKDFVSRNGIKHITSSPYHPSSNGLAERAVQSFKHAIKKIPGQTVQEKLSKFLFNYRITPHTTTGIPPAELLVGRRLRSRLDLLYPEVSSKVEHQQHKQKQQHDSGKPLRKFSVGDKVYAQNFSKTNATSKWLAGIVVRVTGPLSYETKLADDSIVRRHVDNLRSPFTGTNDTRSESAQDSTAIQPTEVELPEELAYPAPDDGVATAPPEPLGPRPRRRPRQRGRRARSQPPLPSRQSSRSHAQPDYYGR